jgi:diguanylate cyclase (GGDEF)-like protein
MRVDVDFEGYLCRVRGDRFESVAIYSDGAPPPPRVPFSVREPYFLAQLRNGSTRMWDDVQGVPELTQLSGDLERSWRSVIATMFSVSSVCYVVVFASSNKPAVPLDANDSEFADVLATLISTQLHQTWQVERMVFQAEHDVLTGLRNRSAFRSNIVRAIASGNGAVMIGHINGLAEITRSLGALASDALLVEVGAALEHALKDGDMVARIGDAQFGILMPGATGSDVGRRVDAYVQAIDRPFALGDRSAEATLDITLCFGVALFPSDGKDAESIITHATAAYDEARGRGRRSLVYFEPSIERDYQARRSSLAELRRAITEEQFVPYYQPIVDLFTDRVVGAESLVRWDHPTRGIVLPDDFLGLAKETGLIAEIDAIVARIAIADTRALAAGNPVFRNYVNLTAERMRNEGTVASLLDLLREFDVPTSMLGVEITESTAMLDVQESRIVLGRFRHEGIRIALDDFGTGFSSLAYLKTFPIDVLKIDRTFIEGLPDSRDDKALVESMAAIAKNFGFSLHAEGVSNDRQWRWLLDHGCETIQGFAYGKPMPRDAYIAWRNARSGNPALAHS